MKQIFIIVGEPMTGKSTLFRKAFKNNNSEVKVSFLIEDYYIGDKTSRKKLISFIEEYKEGMEYLTLITCNKEKLSLLIEELKNFNIPISICEMKRG